MYIQPGYNRNLTFGTKVILTPRAKQIMNGYNEDGKEFMNDRFEELENDGKKEVLLVDYTGHSKYVQLTNYKMVDGKLCKNKEPYPFGAASEAVFNWACERASDNMVPVEKIDFDKYDPILAIVKDYCEE